jgi:DNA-binding IclR family transcriptional regulator
MQSVSRTAAVLRTLRDTPAGLSLGKIAEKAGLPKSTVHRLVTALEAEHLVVSAGSNGRVRLGPELAGLAAAASAGLRERIRPHLEALLADVGETVDLAVLDGTEVLFIDQITAAHRLRAVSAIDGRFPLHCTANGKAMLAKLPRERAAALLPPRLARLTPDTITSRQALWEELDAVAQRGLAFDREEHTVGISAVGAAIATSDGQLAAITIVAPAARFAGVDDRLAEALRATVSAAQQALDSSA